MVAVLVLSPSNEEEDDPLPMNSINLLETILPSHINHVTLKFLNVHKTSRNDSGIICIALACDVCFNAQNISSIYVNARGHLFACLQNDEMITFQSNHREIVSKFSNVIKVDKL